MSVFKGARQRLGRWVRATRDVNEILRQKPEDRRYLTQAYDDRVPLPDGATDYLSAQHPRLLELRERYAALNLPATSHIQWGERATDFIQDHLRYFRGDTPYVWHYRDTPKITRLKYFVFLEYIRSLDNRHLLDSLKEDGAFGCWTFGYPERPRVSRDLLDAINEILFLDRQVGLFEREKLRILDIGAGYGRLAHRLVTAADNVTDYCCVDAVPESTFLCEYYLRFRQLNPVARAVPLFDVEAALNPGDFDIAFNIHSFSECTLDAVSWWVAQLVRLQVPQLLIIPNDPEKLLTNEGGGQKRDFLPLLETAGYKLAYKEPVFADPAVRDVMGIHDQFFLFERVSS